jgi:hypothetical protein
MMLKIALVLHQERGRSQAFGIRKKDVGYRGEVMV